MRSLSDDERIARARAADIADIASRVGARLKRVTSAEWAGPCPACGGEDRFSINVKGRVFNCRGSRGGDVIALVEHALGLNFVEAVEFITGEKQIAAPTRVATDKGPKSPVADKPDGRAPWLWRQRCPVADVSPPSTYLRQARGFTGVRAIG
jgi:phage/plasmid primase-like uncharacterized protein